MSRFGAIPLVRAHGFGRLPELLEHHVGLGHVETVFRLEGLPLSVRDEPITPIPLRAMIGIFNRSEHLLGQRTFGLIVGQDMSYRGYGLWLEYSASAPTLASALQRVVATSWAHMSSSSMSLISVGSNRYLLQFPVPDCKVKSPLYSDHMIPPMLNFIRLYLGASWRPEWIEVDYERDREAYQVEDMLQVSMHHGCSGNGVILQEHELHAPHRNRVQGNVRLVTLRDVFADIVLSTTPEPIKAFCAIVALRLMDGRTDIEGAAELVGLGVQSLQRRLRQHGWTYREVVNDALHRRAARLLLETRMTILEIALCLGYETHGSFTRAFVRWASCAPSEYRLRYGARVRAPKFQSQNLRSPLPPLNDNDE